MNINSKKPQAFLTLENNRLHVWDFERIKNPISTIKKGSSGPLLCGQWNPHNANDLMFGGVSKSIKMVDYRMLGSDIPMSKVVVSANQSLRLLRHIGLETRSRTCRRNSRYQMESNDSVLGGIC